MKTLKIKRYFNIYSGLVSVSLVTEKEDKMFKSAQNVKAKAELQNLFNLGLGCILNLKSTVLIARVKVKSWKKLIGAKTAKERKLSRSRKIWKFILNQDVPMSMTTFSRENTTNMYFCCNSAWYHRRRCLRPNQNQKASCLWKKRSWPDPHQENFSSWSPYRCHHWASSSWWKEVYYCYCSWIISSQWRVENHQKFRHAFLQRSYVSWQSLYWVHCSVPQKESNFRSQYLENWQTS